MKHLLVHMKNKYPNGKIDCHEDSLDVYDADGEHRLALRKNGAGGISDMSQEYGLPDRFDLAPIPKDSRCYKHCPKGNVIKDEKFAEREKAREAYLRDGKILSCEELKAEGYEFDERQVLRSAPAKA